MNARSRKRQVGREAAAWWVRLQDPSVPRREREQFVSWLRESQAHVAEILRVAKVHDALEQLATWTDVRIDSPSEIDDCGNVLSFPSEQRPDLASALRSSGDGRVSSGAGAPSRWVSSRGRPILLALAGSFAVIMMITALLLPAYRSENITTQRGERREIALRDGTVLELGPETHLEVAFTAHVRHVHLESGRALFKVQDNPARPFVVTVGGTTVRDVGTVFGIERRSDNLIVTVASGEVRVADTSSGRGRESTARPSSVTVRSVAVRAGEQVTVDRSDVVGPVHKVDSEQALAWADGRLVFENESVAPAIEEFNQFNRLQIRLENQALARRKVSAVFDATDPMSFASFLQREAGARVTRTGDEIILR